MRMAFTRMVSKQWKMYVPEALTGYTKEMTGPQFEKGRFIGTMYARACYSMLLVSQRGPRPLRALLGTSALLPSSRRLTIELGFRFAYGNRAYTPEGVPSATDSHVRAHGHVGRFVRRRGFRRSAGSSSGCVVDSSSLTRESRVRGENDCGLDASRTADGNSLASRILGGHTSTRCPKILRSRGSSSPGRTRFNRNGPPLGRDRRGNQGHVVRRRATNGTSGRSSHIRDGPMESRAAMDGGHHVIDADDR